VDKNNEIGNILDLRQKSAIEVKLRFVGGLDFFKLFPIWTISNM